jgi:hypothetical protein
VKTLLFCTAYANSQEVWRSRYQTWYRHYFGSALKVTSFLVVDDGSPEKPNFLNDNEYFRFEYRLGRDSAHNYPGWYRSFSFGITQGIRKGFGRIIHCESDAFLLSDRIIEFVNSLDTGWHTFWSNQYGLPESAIQVICRDNFDSANNFLSVPYSTYVGQCMDAVLPYTDIHRNFIGERYGECGGIIPQNADFSCQTSSDMLKAWLHEKAFLQKL